MCQSCEFIRELSDEACVTRLIMFAPYAPRSARSGDSKLTARRNGVKTVVYVPAGSGLCKGRR